MTRLIDANMDAKFAQTLSAIFDYTLYRCVLLGFPASREMDANMDAKILQLFLLKHGSAGSFDRDCALVLVESE